MTTISFTIDTDLLRILIGVALLIPGACELLGEAVHRIEHATNELRWIPALAMVAVAALVGAFLLLIGVGGALFQGAGG